MADTGTVARPYARALFEIAQAAGNLNGWSEALHAAAAVLGEPDAKRFLANPDLTDAKRAAFIETVGGDMPGGALLKSNEGKGLLGLLAENGRLAALAEIAAQFDALKVQAENKVKVTLISATPVDDAIATQVANAIKQKLGRSVELSREVQPEILGGAIIRAEDMVIDASVRTRLKQLGETLAV